jgi:hypothetical protein
MNIYYVYAYIRKSDGTPYYIGKGKGERAFRKEHSVTVPNDKTKIVFLEKNLTEVGALALERRYIRWYGRKDLNEGVLHNRTDGGEGNTCRKIPEETRKKMSLAQKNKPPVSETTRKKLREIRIKLGSSIFTEEVRNKMSKARKLRITTDETRKKLSEAGKKRAPDSEETRKKKIESAKLYWINKRIATTGVQPDDRFTTDNPK